MPTGLDLFRSSAFLRRSDAQPEQEIAHRPIPIPPFRRDSIFLIVSSSSLPSPAWSRHGLTIAGQDRASQQKAATRSPGHVRFTPERGHRPTRPACRFVPKADSCTATYDCRGNLLDHLVGEREQRRRDVEAEGFRGRAVDDELKFDGRLYRKIARLTTLEDAIDISRCLVELLG